MKRTARIKTTNRRLKLAAAKVLRDPKASKKAKTQRGEALTQRLQRWLCGGSCGRVRSKTCTRCMVDLREMHDVDPSDSVRYAHKQEGYADTVAAKRQESAIYVCLIVQQ